MGVRVKEWGIASSWGLCIQQTELCCYWGDFRLVP